MNLNLPLIMTLIVVVSCASASPSPAAPAADEACAKATAELRAERDTGAPCGPSLARALAEYPACAALQNIHCKDGGQ